MFKYRNVKTGQVLERHAPDEWLEASSGWERIAPVPEIYDESGYPLLAGLEAMVNERRAVGDDNEGSKD